MKKEFRRSPSEVSLYVTRPLRRAGVSTPGSVGSRRILGHLEVPSLSTFLSGRVPSLRIGRPSVVE